jgi:hypothetical protein
MKTIEDKINNMENVNLNEAPADTKPVLGDAFLRVLNRFLNN